MGSAFRVPLWTGSRLLARINWCRERGVFTIAPRQSLNNLYEVNWRGACALIVGLSRPVFPGRDSNADEAVRIPMKGSGKSKRGGSDGNNPL